MGKRRKDEIRREYRDWSSGEAPQVYVEEDGDMTHTHVYRHDSDACLAALKYILGLSERDSKRLAADTTETAPADEPPTE